MKHDMTHAWHNLRLPPRNSNNIIITNSNGNSGNNGNAPVTPTSSKIEVYQVPGPLNLFSSSAAKSMLVELPVCRMDSELRSVACTIKLLGS
jgi:hypothetical protein